MLMRFDPFREFDRLTELPHRFGTSSILAMDAYRHGREFVIQLDLPGADPDSIDVSVEKNVLTVRASRTAVKVEADAAVVTERRYGRFTRQLFLGESLDTDRITAGYDNGVLTVTVPVAEKATPRQIRIHAGVAAPTAVETGAADSADSADSTDSTDSADSTDTAEAA